MSVILHTGFEDKLKEAAERYYRTDGPKVFFETYNPDAQTIVANDIKKADLFMIGPGAPDPFQVAQKVYAADKHLSILIVAPEERLKQLNQAMRFAPFVGSSLKCISAATKRRLDEEIKKAVERTVRRRRFSEVARYSAGIKPSPPVVDGARAQFRDVFLENAPVGAVLAHPDGKIITVNRQLKRLFADWEEACFHELFPDDMQEEIQQFVKSRGDGEERKVIELKTPRKAYLELKKTFFSVSGEESGYIIILVNDITDKEVYELSLKEAIHQLAVRNEELENFAHIISHDLKNPLISLQTLVDRCRNERDPAKIERLLDMIATSAGKMAGVHTDLERLLEIQHNEHLAVARLAFRKEFEAAWGDLRELWSAAGAIFRLDLQASHIHYVKPYLRSIFVNLLSNAVKYADPGRRPEVLVRTYVEDGFTVLSVADNGIGIDLQKHRHKLFQPYYRLSSQASGKGIGLSLVKRMVEKNGGFTQVFSTPGKGSEFLCFLKEY